MPRKASNYANGIQYKIVCNDPAITDCYNGSCISFKDRKKSHKNDSRNPTGKRYNYKVYQFIREHGGWENWSMVQLEEYPCKSRQELFLRERHWFDLIKPTLNTNSPTLDVENRKRNMAKYAEEHKDEFVLYQKQYRDENKIELAFQKQQYYAKNKDEILAYRKQYRAENNDKIVAKQKQHYTENKVKIAAKTKIYRAENQNEIAAKKQQYYTDNKVEILAKYKQKVKCVCGCEVCNRELTKHMKTAKHFSAMTRLAL